MSARGRRRAATTPRQRRAIVLILLAVVCAIGVFFAVHRYVQEVTSRVGPMSIAYTLNRDVPAYTPIQPGMFSQVEVPERWLPTTYIDDLDDVMGLVATGDLVEGSLAQRGMFELPPEIAEGFREIAILVNAETGVAGKVGPGDRVDLIATFSDESGESAQIWVANVEVIAIGALSDGSSGLTGEARAVVPVTFELTPADALRVAYAESFAVNMRMALRAPTDDAAVDESSTRFGREG